MEIKTGDQVTFREAINIIETSESIKKYRIERAQRVREYSKKLARKHRIQEYLRRKNMLENLKELRKKK